MSQLRKRLTHTGQDGGGGGAACVAAYSIIQIVEGIGLWLLKRWGEWFAVIATCMFIPFEVWEVIDHLSLTKISALVINLAAVAYLVYTKKL